MTDQSANSPQQPFTALVEYQIRTANTTMPQWLDTWSARGQDALLGEPETTAYAAALADSEDSNVLIFERYLNGQASLDAHTNRPAHATLVETMASSNMTKRRVMSNRFDDVDNYGWWGRPNHSATATRADVLMTLIVTRFSSPDMQLRYLELTGEHAKYCHAAEPDTLIYSGGIAQRDSDRGPQIKAGDLLFVAAFANPEAAIKHRDDPRHLALQPKLETVERERVSVQSYRSSGKGYLFR